MSSSRGEPIGGKGGRPRVINDPHRNVVGTSLDLSKASPSNGQCPTAVSSRNQTIPSREIQRHKASISGAEYTPKQQNPHSSHQSQQYRPLQIQGDAMADQVKMISKGSSVAEDEQLATDRGDTGENQPKIQKQYTFHEVEEQNNKDTISSLDGPPAKDLLSQSHIDSSRVISKTRRDSQMKIMDQHLDSEQQIASARNRPGREDQLRKMRQSNQDSETVSYKLKMQNNAGGGNSGTDKLRKQKKNMSTRTMLPPSQNQILQKNNLGQGEFNNLQMQHDAVTTSRSKYNQSPSIDDSIGRPIQISNKRPPSFDMQGKEVSNFQARPLADSTDDYAADFHPQMQSRKSNYPPHSVQDHQHSQENRSRREGTPIEYQHSANQEAMQTHEASRMNSVRGGRDESPPMAKDATVQPQSSNIRNQQQRLSQPDRINTQASRQNQSSKQASPKQNARSFIIRNTTQNYSVPTQPGVHQPKVLPPVMRGQAGSKKSKNVAANPMIESKKASPKASDSAQRDGHLRRLSQNQHSINLQLEQESKFESTKDASDMGGRGGPGSSCLNKDYNSSLPDSIRVKGAQQDRSYDEAWQVDQGSSASQHGAGSCDQRLDSAQTALLSKRRPSQSRLNQDFFDHSVQRSEDQSFKEQVPTPMIGQGSGKPKKHMQLTQPRTKDMGRKQQNMRGTLQSQNQNRFVDEIDEEYLQQHSHNNKARLTDGTRSKNNYHSPAHLREIGLSQQMVPNQMKQQLKQHRTVYGQSFFNSPPYPSQQQHLMHHDGGRHDSGRAEPMGGPLVEKTRNAQLDSSLRRKRQLPFPQHPPQPQQSAKYNPGVKKLSSNQEVVQTRNSMQQSFPLQVHAQLTQQIHPGSQQRKTIQRHKDSAPQHLEFDERQQNEGKISQLSRFNIYQAGMRNVLTAGENSPRVVDHFPVTRAGRWKQGQPPNAAGAYDMMQVDDGMDPPGQQPNRSNQNQAQPYAQQTAQDDMGVQRVPAHFHNPKKLPKRSGTASYITTGGVRITINKDNKHLNGANLTTQTEENMNLMFYDFNNAGVIPEETQRNLLRSQTTDRGPSRKLRSRGRFKLASSNQQKRGKVESAGIGDIQPFQVSTEFEMGMYPPGEGPTTSDRPEPFQIVPMEGPIPEMSVHGSPSKAQQQQVEEYQKQQNLKNGPLQQADRNFMSSKYDKNGNRNIQAKRLSSQTHIQRSAQGTAGQQSSNSNSIISSQNPNPMGDSHQHHPQQLHHHHQKGSPSAGQKNNNFLGQPTAQRRVQKQYRANGISSTDQQQQHNQGVSGHTSHAGNSHQTSAGNNRQLPKKNQYGVGQGMGPRGEVYRNYSREGARGGEHAQMNNQPQPTMPALSRIPQHRQTNLANVMESIREEDPHL